MKDGTECEGDVHARFAKAAEEVRDKPVIANPGIVAARVLDRDWDDGDAVLGRKLEKAWEKRECAGAARSCAFGKSGESDALLQQSQCTRASRPAARLVLSPDKHGVRLPSGRSKKRPLGDLRLGKKRTGSLGEEGGDVHIRAVVCEEQDRTRRRTAVHLDPHTEETHHPTRPRMAVSGGDMGTGSLDLCAQLEAEDRERGQRSQG